MKGQQAHHTCNSPAETMPEKRHRGKAHTHQKRIGKGKRGDKTELLHLDATMRFSSCDGGRSKQTNGWALFYGNTESCSQWKSVSTIDPSSFSFSNLAAVAFTSSCADNTIPSRISGVNNCLTSKSPSMRGSRRSSDEKECQKQYYNRNFTV